jgi:hypothetical protein
MSKSEEFVKGVWKQEPLLHTPQELTHLAQKNLSPHHEGLGNKKEWDDPNHPGNNELHYRGNNKDSAAGECDTACRIVHDYLPHGSHQVIYDDHPRQWNHFVHHVPTTEGMYVVDYTQRQFNANAKFPVVEPMGKFQARQSMKQFGTMKSSKIDLYRADKEGNIDPNQ